MQKGDQFADKLLVRLVVDTSVENYKYNKTFFQNKIIFDVQPRLMSKLDHLSNIQFIRTSKHLYEKYVQKTSDGIKYNDCLFTTIPFDFDYYTRALFHYAPQHEVQTKILLSIEDEIIQGASTKMLKKCKINGSDTDAVMNFYRQRFSDDQMSTLVNNRVLFNDMLKKGLCCHTTGHVLKFFDAIWYAALSGEKESWDELFSRLLRYSSFDPNAKSDSDTLLKRALADGWINTMKTLLDNPAIHRNVIKEACGYAIFKNNIEAIKILLPFIDLKQDGAELIDTCVIYRFHEVLKIFLSYPEIDLNKKDAHGFTLLRHAALVSDIEAVRILLADERVDPSVGGLFSTAYSSAKNPAIKALLSKHTPFYKKYPFVSLIMAAVLVKIIWSYSMRFI